MRPFNAYGPAQTPDRVVPEIMTKALRGQNIAMTQGRQTREFNYVEDIADGFVRAATTPGTRRPALQCRVRAGGGHALSGVDHPRLMGDPVKVEFGALPERPTEIPRMCADSSKARSELGWQPRHTLADGLEKTIAWHRAELAVPGSPFIGQ